MKKYIPIKSLRSFQRYMGKADEFQINSKSNMGGSCPGSVDTYDTPDGGWVPVTNQEARGHAVKQSWLQRPALRAVIVTPESILP